MVAVKKQSGAGTPAPIPEMSPEVKSAFNDMVRSSVEEVTKERGLAPYGHIEEVNPVIKLADWNPRDTKIVRLPVLKNQEEWDRRDPQFKGAGVRLAQFVKAVGWATRNGKSLADAATGLGGAGKLDPFVVKALQENTIADGGNMVRPEFAAEMIPLLRAKSVLDKLGIANVEMTSPELVYSKQNQSASASYVGETMAATVSQAKTGDLKFQAKKLKAITSITDELLNDAGPNADKFLREDLSKVIALRGDLAGIRGDGTQNSPLGLRYAIASQNIFAATQAGASPTLPEVNSNLGQMIQRLEDANAPMQRVGWIMNPRTKLFLMTLLNPQGFYVFRDEMRSGTLMGYPFGVTTQIPKNLGAGSNETELYLVDLDEYMQAVLDELIIQAFPNGTFLDASGQPVYGVNQGVTPIVAQYRHDYGLRHTDAAACLTAVKWF